MRRVVLAILFASLASGAFAGEIRYFYGLPSHYGTDHYSIWFGRLPKGIVPTRVCVHRYRTWGYEVWKVCHPAAWRHRHER